jgi:xylulokinase
VLRHSFVIGCFVIRHFRRFHFPHGHGLTGVSIMNTLVGVDIGTQGTKAALFAEDGRCLSQAFCPSALQRPAPGAVEEDPERQYQSVCETIRQCVRRAQIDKAAVSGIGLDGQMAGIIGVGADGRHVTPYDSWLDTRCAPYIKRMEQEAGAQIVEQAGCPPSFNHGPKKLWWLHERKSVYRRIAAFVQPGGYAAMRLCGLDGAHAFIDHTYLHFSGLADNRRAAWDVGMCRWFGLDEAKLPAIVRPETIVGQLTAAAARACGLKPGVPVVAGCGDTAASFLACGAAAEGIGVDVAGTASVFAMTTAEFRPDVRRRMLACGRSAVPGLWHPYAYINGGGMNLEWFCRELAPGLGQASRERLDPARLDELAAAIEPDERLPLFVPHLGGRVCPAQPDLRGAWAGLTWDHGPAYLYRAVLEGVALEYAVYKQTLLALYDHLSVKELRVTGGGRLSGLWNRLKADTLQVPLRRVARDEGAPLGAALVAGFGVGLLRSLPEAAKQWITLGEATRPRRSLAAHAARRVARYEALVEQLNRWATDET